MYDEVVEVDERVMLAEFFDENRSDEEIELLEHSVEATGQCTSNYPKAGMGKRIKGITGEKVSLVADAVALSHLSECPRYGWIEIR